MAEDKCVSDIVGERLRALRKSKRMTVEDLASRCKEAGSPELTSPVIYGIENGRRKGGVRTRHVTVDELPALAAALSVTSLNLLTDGGSASDAESGSDLFNAVSKLADAIAGLSGDNVSAQQVRHIRRLYRLLGVELDEVEDNYR